MAEKNETLRGVFAEAIRAEYGSHAGKANIVLCVLYTILVIALTVPKTLEIVADAGLRAVGREQLKDVTIPTWVQIVLIVLIPITFGICLYIVYKMSDQTNENR